MRGLLESAAPLAGRVMARCDELAGITADASGIHRFYLTPEHHQCNDRLAILMGEAGMTTWEDEAGNLWGRYRASADAGDDARALILGSHHDSVPNAGRYDGPLGVLTAIAVVELLHRHNRRLPFHVDIVAFGDEEGARFGTTLLGSYPVAGHWSPDWWELADADGVTLQQAFKAFGLKPDDIPRCARDPEELLGYLELHIEQGPVLEEGDHPLGIVTGIAGARRFRLAIEGRAGHAGTVPMGMRRDALLGACEFATLVERVANDAGIVATVGQLECQPGAVNVIPGKALCSLDIRAPGDSQRDSALERIRSEFDSVCAERGLEVTWEETHSAPAVDCAGWLQDHQSRALESLALSPIQLMSGAGHDAMAMARITDVAMFFIRCAGGISHHPDESVMEADVACAIAAMAGTLFNIEASAGRPS